MTVSSVSSSNAWVAQLRGAATGRARHPDQDGDGDDGGTGGAGAVRGPQGGGFVNALASTFAQMGLDVSKLSSSASTTTSTSATSDTTAASGTTSQDPAQALSSFMHTLMSTLHAQGTQTAGSSNGGNGDGSSGVDGAHGHHHRGNLKAELQGLIQKLGSASASTGSDTTGAASSSDPAVAALQQSFQNLASAFGDTDSKATLQNFLQSFASQLNQQSPQGQLVNATA